MTEENTNVAEDIQQEEVVQPEAENAADSGSQDREEVSDKEINFKRLREAKEELERENRELRSAIESSQKKKEPPKEEEDLLIDDDDIVDGKTVKQLYKELKELKQFRSSYEQEKIASVPDRLRSKFSDFDRVVTAENVEKLKRTEPELYAAITSGSDLYTKGVSAYKTLKGLGIVDDESLNNKDRIEANQKKPLSSQAIKGQGALSEANRFATGLTPELRDQLRKEMTDAIKGF